MLKSKPKNEEDLSPRIFKANRLEFGEAEVKPASLNAKNLRERNKQKEVVQRIMINDLQIKGLHNSVQPTKGKKDTKAGLRPDLNPLRQPEKLQQSLPSKSEKSAPPVVWGPTDSTKLGKEVISIFPGRYVRDPSEVVNSFRDDLVIRLIKNSFKQLEKRRKQAVSKPEEITSVASRNRLTIQQQMISNLKTKLAKINAETVKQPTYSQLETERKVGYLEGKRGDSLILRHRVPPRRPEQIALMQDVDMSRHSNHDRSLGHFEHTRTLKFEHQKEATEVRLLDVEAESAFKDHPTGMQMQSCEKLDTLPPLQGSLKSSQTDPIGFLSENSRFTRFKGAMEVRKLHQMHSGEVKVGSMEEFSDRGAGAGLNSVMKSAKRPQFAYDHSRRTRMQAAQPKEVFQTNPADMRPAEMKEDNLSSTRYDVDLSKSVPGFSIQDLKAQPDRKTRNAHGHSQSNPILEGNSTKGNTSLAMVMLDTPAAVHTYLAFEKSAKTSIFRHKKMPSMDVLSGRQQRTLLEIDTATGVRVWRNGNDKVSSEFPPILAEATVETTEKSAGVASTLQKESSQPRGGESLPQVKPAVPPRQEVSKPAPVVLTRDKSADMHSLKSWSHHSGSSGSLGML